MKLVFRVIAFISLVLIVHPTFAVTIYGIVTDEENLPVSFCSVIILESRAGSTANVKGYYSIEVSPGNFQLQFRSIGYKTQTLEVQAGQSDVELNVVMKKEVYQLNEVVVEAGEDPAYAIIRKAQQMRKIYRDQATDFSCRAYMKSTQRLYEYPKKLLGQPVDLSEFLDTTTNIIYLSESVSELKVSGSDRAEKMISSKVSGSNRSFSFNRASEMIVDFYENLITISNLTPRGIVSPISASAMMFYNYRFEGSFMENGQLINKIRVQPKRKSDPVFSGEIFIADSSWRIHSIDVFITKNQQLEFIDTFRIRQSYIPVSDMLWKTFQSEFKFSFSFLGFKGSGTIIGLFNNYNLSIEKIKLAAGGEIQSIEKDANKKDSLYWAEVRLVPLTREEDTDYIRRDSTSKVFESREYRDSVDKKENRFKPLDFVLTGYRWQNSFHKRYFFISGLSSNIQFNTIEGWNASMTARYAKGNEDGRTRDYAITSVSRYGFSNKHLNSFISFSKPYAMHRLGHLRMTGGTALVQFNNDNPISEIVNTFNTLVLEANHLKAYEKYFIRFRNRFELSNGVLFSASAEFANRIPLVNTSDTKLFQYPGRDYKSNDPLYETNLNPSFKRHNALHLDFSVRLRFKQKYLSRPEGKIILGSKYPDLLIRYRTGINHLLNSDVSFDVISTTINHAFKSGLFGNTSYELTFGKFLGTKKLYFMDYYHFNGNKTYFSAFRLSDFKLLDYYGHSSNDDFWEMHVEHNFEGFILNKIPLVRKLKLNEIAGFRHVATFGQKSYYETSFGIEKLRLIRADIVFSFGPGVTPVTGFIFGLKLNVSNGSVSIIE